MLHMLGECQHKEKLEHLFSPANGIEKKAESRVMTCTMFFCSFLTLRFACVCQQNFAGLFHCQRRVCLKKLILIIRLRARSQFSWRWWLFVAYFLQPAFSIKKKAVRSEQTQKPIRGGGFNEVIWRIRLESLRNCLTGKKYSYAKATSVFFYTGQLEKSWISILRNASERNACEKRRRLEFTIRWFMLRLRTLGVDFAFNCMWTYRQVFWCQMFSGHQVGELQVELGTNGFGGHLNGAAWGGTCEWNHLLDLVNRIPITWNLPGV